MLACSARGRRRTPIALFLALGSLAACGGAGPAGSPSAATVRAERRAYDGAPPVVAHDGFGMSCESCHNDRGVRIADVGFAPPSPHASTQGMSAIARCRQCHVFRQTESQFVANDFAGLVQDLRRGPRPNEWAPPTMPHKTFMRENCFACHAGEAAREAIRTPHPERVRCRQCHVPTATREAFSSGFGPGS